MHETKLVCTDRREFELHITWIKWCCYKGSAWEYMNFEWNYSLLIVLKKTSSIIKYKFTAILKYGASGKHETNSTH